MQKYNEIDDFWKSKVEIKDNPNVARINGVHYFIGDENEKGTNSFRGFDGKKFKIKFNDGREVETTNLWYNGKIPKEYEKDLPDNAIFIEEDMRERCEKEAREIAKQTQLRCDSLELESEVEKELTDFITTALLKREKEIEELKQANKNANALIADQADESQRIVDKLQTRLSTLEAEARNLAGEITDKDDKILSLLKASEGMEKALEDLRKEFALNENENRWSLTTINLALADFRAVKETK